MDVLSSGPDRPRRRPLAGVRSWRPPRRWVAVQAALLGTVVVAAVLSLGPVRERAELAGLELRVLSSTVAVRGGSTEGVLRVAVGNDGPAAVDVTGAELDLPGVVLLPVPARLPRRLEPGDRVEVDVPFRVPSCADLPARGLVRLDVTVQGRAPRVLELPVDDAPGDGLDLAAFAAGCRPTSASYVVAVSVDDVSGAAQGGGETARGDLLVELRNAGAAVRVVSVTGEVPGVLFVSRTSPTGERVTGPGERVSVPLPFVIPFCEQVAGTGRLLVTVRDESGALRSLVFPADEGSGLDLTSVYGACQASG